MSTGEKSIICSREASVDTHGEQLDNSRPAFREGIAGLINVVMRAYWYVGDSQLRITGQDLVTLSVLFIQEKEDSAHQCSPSENLNL